MKINSLLFVLPFICSVSFAQSEFEPGFIVDNFDKKIECYIKNSEWGNNPKEFKYKKSLEDRDVILAKIADVKLFQINSHTRYERHTVNIDRSSQKLVTMSTRPEPEFSSETIFLKKLVEGEANLFEYRDNGRPLYFYSVLNAPISQLIYKQYMPERNKVLRNEAFRKQLNDDLNCARIDYADLKALNYDKTDLMKFFENHNNCSANTSTTYAGLNSKGSFNFGLKVGYFNAGLEVDLSSGREIEADRQSTKFSSKYIPRFAAEIEYVLPSKEKKWTTFLEIGYQSYSNTDSIETDSNLESSRFIDVEVDYSFIDISIGLRRYFSLAEESKLFIHGGFSMVADLSEKIDYEESNGIVDLDINSSINVLFGIGFEYKDKVNIELRYNTPRDITTDYSIVKSNFNSAGVLLGYKFF